MNLVDFSDACRAFLTAEDGRSEHTWAAARAFHRRRHDAGLAGITVPVVFGGLGLTADHQRAFDEEAAGRDLPLGFHTITLGMCVPVLLEHGTDEQRRRHVPAMLRGDEVWCQLFSEPNAGSDVAAAQTAATRDGDEWMLRGQKVWTSSALESEMGMCIARTDPALPKHRGLTMFAMPMGAHGVTVRPLVQATGDAGFNEVFLDDVRLPLDAVIGGPGQGWSVVISMLMNERMALGGAGNSLLSGRTAAAIAAGGEPAVAADLYTREEILRVLGARVAGGPAGSLAKLFGSDLVRRAAEARVHAFGARAAAWLPGDADAVAAARDFVAAPSLSIAGGTSEVQRTILGERVLGLPREPDAWRDVPFRDVPQNRPPR